MAPLSLSRIRCFTLSPQSDYLGGARRFNRAPRRILAFVKRQVGPQIRQERNSGLIYVSHFGAASPPSSLGRNACSLARAGSFLSTFARASMKSRIASVSIALAVLG